MKMKHKDVFFKIKMKNMSGICVKPSNQNAWKIKLGLKCKIKAKKEKLQKIKIFT